MVKNLIKHLQVPNRFILNIGINPAILLTELIDKERYLSNEGKLEENNHFFHEYKYIYKNTGLLKSRFNTAKKKLLDLGLIHVKYGEGKRLLYKIDSDKLLDIFFPKSKDELNNEDFLELLLDDGYIFYPAVLAHKLGINETIFIRSLISKRKTFLNKNKLKNGYFFNSVSNIKNDTSLSRDQQLKCIKNLVELSLLDVKYDYDNTRYFCINIDLIAKFESFELNDIIKSEVGFNDKVESGLSNKSHIKLKNPFTNKESRNYDDQEVGFNDNTEVIKTDSPESRISDKQKIGKTTTSSNISGGAEDVKPYINNNKKENKQINQNNNIKEMLLEIFNNSLLVDKLLLSYKEEIIIKVIKEADSRDLENKAGFIRWALENDVSFSDTKEPLKKLREKSKQEEMIADQKNEVERNRIIEQKKKYLDWKNTNKDKYNELYNTYKEELDDGNLSEIRLNIETEIRTKKYILENYLNNN